MKDILARCAVWSALLIVVVCFAMPTNPGCHPGCTRGVGSIPAGDAVGRRLDAAEPMAFQIDFASICNAPARGEGYASTSPVLLPINLTDGQNGRGVANHGYDLGSALAYHVPSGWIRPGEYLHPIDVPLITHVLPCYVSTHDPIDPAQGPVFGSAAVTWTIPDHFIQGTVVEVRRITSALRWS